jgi:hypothetical protein
MSSTKGEDYSSLFPIYLVIFCVINWGVLWHYKTSSGPTVSAVVVDKQQVHRKNGYYYYLTIRFTTLKQQTATSELSVEEGHYPDFAINDSFLIKYAEDDPTETAFVGEPFFRTWAVVGYLFVVFVLVSSSVAKYRKLDGPAQLGGQQKILPTPTLPVIPAYSAKRALIWTAIGVLTFSSGIVSCRHTAYIDRTPPEANEYTQAHLLSVQYRPDAPAATALVRLSVAANDSAKTRTIRLPLSAEQHALLHAKLARPQAPALEVLVKYPVAAPNHATLADEQPSASAGSTDSFVNYSMLGMGLCSIGIVIFVVNLAKYIQRSNSYE